MQLWLEHFGYEYAPLFYELCFSRRSWPDLTSTNLVGDEQYAVLTIIESRLLDCCIGKVQVQTVHIDDVIIIFLNNNIHEPYKAPYKYVMTNMDCYNFMTRL